MLSNYLKVALRMVLRQKSFVLLNIFGLSIGLAASMLMLLFVMHEFSYDSFHADAERIVRVLEKRKDWGGNVNSVVETRLFADSSIFPPKSIESIVQVLPIGNYSGKQDIRVSVGGIQKPFFEQEGLYVTPNFFSMFPFPALCGNPHKTLLQPNSIVITERAALRYFGTVEALGKTITFEKYRSDTTQRMYLVGAVIADLPSNTSFHGDFFVPMSSYLQMIKERNQYEFSHVRAETFIMLGANVHQTDILRTLQTRQKLLETKFSPNMEYGAVEFFLQPLTDVYANRLGLEKIGQKYLKSGTKANVEQITILGILAFVLMFIACLNYINLQTARVGLRGKEVAVRKVIGARRSHILGQFFIETTLLVGISFLLGCVLVELALPFSGTFLGKKISMHFFSSPRLWALYFVLFVSIVVVCGGFPAFLVSRLSPMLILRRFQVRSKVSSLVRQTLVVLQFIGAVSAIIALLVMQSQMNFIRSKNLGFEKENLVVVKLRKPEHGKDFRRLKQVLMRESGVVAASGCSKKIVGDVGSMAPVPSKGEKAAPPTWFLTTDEDYAATMSLQVKEGRWFQANHADGNFVSVVNETYLRSMQQEYGKDTSVIGSKILGVVRDFHFDSMLEPIQPMEVRLPYVDDSTKKEDIAMNYIMVKLAKGNHAETIKRLEAAWNLAVPNTPFEASFFDDEIQSLYKREQTMTALVGGIGSVIVLVACFGLFGLAAFTAEMRTKEIGIRKVLGASVKSIIALLSRDFLRLVVIAIIIAAPLGYWAMGQWLQGFAYRTELGAGVFFFAGAMAVGIAFMTVAGQAFRAARANPVQSLRSE